MNLNSVASSSGIVSMSLLFLFLVYPVQLHGQISSISPSLTTVQEYSTHQQEPVQGTLNIIAVMVEFEPDSNRFTSGNGTFGPGTLPFLEDHEVNIDPLPHDKNYFEAHLQFTKNYYESMSGGLLEIQYQVLDEIVRLNKNMESYSPLGENPSFNPLAELSLDVWEQLRNSGDLNINLSPANNTAFVIFHAGVGRDIELTGTTLTRTPQDIPSVYLSQSALSDLLEDPTFTGFEIDNGNFLVDNTLILPRTLSREGEDVSGTSFVLPLSINGLLTAQVGSHIGLPDLFNTNTGESGIGRFGLMDGAGIFAFNGLFPPRLSAWEKIYLGWDRPFNVNFQTESTIELPAHSTGNQNRIAKINLSNEEYFLVENRHRDPDGNGVTLTIQSPDGSLSEQTFSNSDEEFVEQQSGFDEHLNPGVVINVSNYDFALPGGFDENNNRNLNGGILIWHVDEGVINRKLGAEGINNNPDRRGVNLQEADGAQDIGRQTQIGVSQNESSGSAFDFWWSGNNATVITQTDSLVLYENRFGPDTTPNNNSNTGAVSNFELFGFSDNQTLASFSIRSVQPFSEDFELADSGQQLSITGYTPSDDLYWERYPLSLIPINLNDNEEVLLIGPDGFQVYEPANKHLFDSVLEAESLQQPFADPASSIFTAAPNPQLSSENFGIETITWDGNGFQTQQQFNTNPNSGFISSFENGILDVDGTRSRINLENEIITESENPVQYSALINGYQSRIEGQNVLFSFPGGETSVNLTKEEAYSRSHTGIITLNRNSFFFYLLSDGKISLYSESDNFETAINLHESAFIDWPVFADLNRDESPDVLFVDRTSNQLIGKNVYGAMLNHFPIEPPTESVFIGTPLLADFNGDGSTDIVITVQDQYSMQLMGYNLQGDPLEGFPLLVGGVVDQLHQPLHPVLTGNKLIAVSHSGELKMWEFKNLQNIVNSGRYGNVTNNKVSGIIELNTDPEFEFTLLNENETYNWPNPATDETNLRFQTREQAEIEIKITTLSGRLIFDKTIQSKGGPAQEIVIDTSSWSSGGYFALITAKNSQHKEQKMVKIAVTK